MALLAAISALAETGAARAACQLGQLAEAPLTVVGGRPLIDGEINGVRVAMLADTGAGKSALLRSLAVEMKLHEMPLQGMTSYGVGGASVPTYVNIDAIRIGSISKRDLPLMVVGENPSFGPTVLIGADFWGQADDEIDLAHGVIRLIRPSGCVGDQVIAYWGTTYAVAKMLIMTSRENTFIVEISLNGVPLRAQLDTGAPRTVVTRQGFAKLHMPWPVDAKDQKDGFTGLGKNAAASAVVTFQSFAFDQETIANPRIAVADIFADDKVLRLGSRTREDAFEFPDMLLGADFFLAHRVLISTSQHKVYISYNGGKLFGR